MLAERVFVCGIALGVHILKAFIESNSNYKIEEVGTDLVSPSTLEPMELGAGGYQRWGLSGA